jgi:ABC-type glycerol-3-phosphate transport system permease component
MAVTARRARRWRRFATYVNLAPFIFFALFPFYFMFVTSFKRNAELYSLTSIPILIQSGVITDH